MTSLNGTPRCGACGGSLGDPLHVRDHTYVRCVACGSAELSPMPALDPAAYYDADYFTANRVGGYVDYDADRDEHVRNAVARVSLVDRHVQRRSPGAGTHLIDVGCASGYVLDEARERGWTVTGVDVSPWAQQQVVEKGHAVHPLLGTAAAERRPDAITFFQSLEHLLDIGACRAGIAAIGARGAHRRHQRSAHGLGRRREDPRVGLDAPVRRQRAALRRLDRAEPASRHHHAASGLDDGAAPAVVGALERQHDVEHLGHEGVGLPIGERVFPVELQ